MMFSGRVRGLPLVAGMRQAAFWWGERPRCRPLWSDLLPETALSALFPLLMGGADRSGGGPAAVVGVGVGVGEDDLLAGECFELGDQPAGVLFGVDPAGVEVVAEIGVGLSAGQHTPDDLDQGVGDGERGFLARGVVRPATETAVQPVKPCPEPGPGPRRGEGGLDQ